MSRLALIKEITISNTFGVTVIVTLVLEHCFTIAKILGSIIGCLVVAFLCYELSDVTPMNTTIKCNTLSSGRSKRGMIVIALESRFD